MDLLPGLLVLLAAGLLAAYFVRSYREGRVYWKPLTVRRDENPVRFTLAMATYYVLAIAWAIFGVVLLIKAK